jgi:hypothetical protein
MFCQQYLNKNFDEKDFSILSRFYEWNTIESDVRSIHNLFKDHFMRRLAMNLKTNDFHDKGFDELANSDLAETVLNDPLWPINGTIEKMQNNIYNQGLYYKAISVCLKNHFIQTKSNFS